VAVVRLAYAEVLVHLVAAVYRAGEHLHTEGKMRAVAASAQVLVLETFVLSPALLVSSGFHHSMTSCTLEVRVSTSWPKPPRPSQLLWVR